MKESSDDDDLAVSDGEMESGRDDLLFDEED